MLVFFNLFATVFFIQRIGVVGRHQLRVRKPVVQRFKNFVEFAKMVARVKPVVITELLPNRNIVHFSNDVVSNGLFGAYN